MRASRAKFLGVAILLGLTVLPLYPRVCLAQIRSFDQARDKLLADAFGGRAPAGEVFGDPRLLAGGVSVETPGGAVRLGAGPGWVFFFRDRSRPRPLNELLLVRTTGTVTRRIIKGEPVSLRDFLPLAPLASGPEGSGSAVHGLEEAYARLLAGLLGHTPGNRRVYALPGKREGRIAAENWQGVLPLGRGPGWVFFIDDNPAANWEHACRFALVTESGKILVVRSTTPPRDLSCFREMTEGMPADGREAERSGTNAAGLPASDTVSSSLGHQAASTPAENRWAVILSGGYNQANNHIRYWNDCSYFYTTLTAHGFLDGNVFVMISDGADPAVDRSDWTNSPTDLDGDGDADTQYSATRANITAVFDALAGLLDGDDILYVFATDHGGSDDAAPYDDPAVKLYLWGESSITDAQFAAEVNKVTTLATVCIFEQCFSGGMLDDLHGPNRVLLSAARFWELSYAMGPSYEYDEFSFHLTHALANPPAGDANSDGLVSLEEGYLYALAHDSKQSEALDGDGDNVGEHPSYYSNPWDLGRRISLAGLAGEAASPTSGGYTQQEVADAYPTGAPTRGGTATTFSTNMPFPSASPATGPSSTASTWTPTACCTSCRPAPRPGRTAWTGSRPGPPSPLSGTTSPSTPRTGTRSTWKRMPRG